MTISKRVAWLVGAIQADDPVLLDAVLDLSRRRRLFAPLALAVGAVAMLLQGVRLLLANWRLTLVQILPAMWIWLAMYDLKAHVFHGKSFTGMRGPILIPVALAIVAITVASLFLDAVFAFAISDELPPRVRPGFTHAREHLKPILVSGGMLGLLLALSTTVITRSGDLWFALSLGIVIGLMMIAYVAVPSRLIGMRATATRRDKLTASAIGTAIGATISTPPYLIGRLGILMLGSPVLFIPGLFVLTFGITLQAGATGAVRAVKLSSKLIGGHPAEDAGAELGAQTAQLEAGKREQEAAQDEHDADDHSQRGKTDFGPREDHDAGDDLEQ
jgi:hypothetical protein